MSNFNIAVVQPHTNPPPDDAENVDDAVRWIERAAGEGADFVCFPESYPGPWRMPAAYDPSARIAEAAHKFATHVVFGTMEPIDPAKRTAYNLTCMAYPDGRRPVRYRRTHPNGPWIYSSRTGGSGVWEFEWVPGNEFPVFDTVHGKVGLGMCSEVYMPEVSRALALRGAEIIFLPAGLSGAGNLWETWHTLLRARAIENLALSSRPATSSTRRPSAGWRSSPGRSAPISKASMSGCRWSRSASTGCANCAPAGTATTRPRSAAPSRACCRNGSAPSSTTASCRAQCRRPPNNYERDNPMGAIVMAVSRSPRHTLAKPNQDSIRLVTGLGVEGDAHQGATVKHRSRVARDPTQPNLRQVHLIHAELHDELRQAGFAVLPGAMGENVTTRGIDLLGLAAGTRLHLGTERGGRGHRAAQPLRPARQDREGADGRDPRPRRARQPRAQGRDHGRRAGRGRGQARRPDPGRAPSPAHRPLPVV